MENENKMYYKPQYKCGICNTVHNSVAERMKCESTCLKKQEDEVKKLEEKKTRKAEIELMYKELNKKIESFVKDYGSLNIGDNRYFDDDNFPNLSKLLGWFL